MTLPLAKAAIIGANVLIAAALIFMFIYFTHDHSTTPD